VFDGVTQALIGFGTPAEAVDFIKYRHN
jgi:hypothetical protein